MTTNAPLATSPTHDSALVSWLIAVVVLLVATLTIGGYWMQSHNQQAAEQRQQEKQYRAYLNNTQEAAAAVQSSPHPGVVQARETREFLLNHPAVTPGEGFHQPGVQATGKAIVQALDRAQSAQQLAP